jgi:hypothetical protein
MTAYSWRLAGSLVVLRSQINKLYPARIKVSDGTIGDARHQDIVSDHNPDTSGVVRALDITHDPEHGCDIAGLFVRLAIGHDPRIKYVIANRRIVSSTTQPWVIRDYAGSDPHTNHIHISVVSDAIADDERRWDLPDQPETGSYPAWPGRLLRRTTPMMHGQDVWQWQQRMRDRGWRLAVDGWYGDESTRICRRFQAEKHLTVDGIVGQATWSAAWLMSVIP